MVSGRFTVRSGKVCEAGCREVDRWDVIRCLVNSVGDSVTGVQLDGGQDGLTAGGGGGNSHWSGGKGCGSWQSSNWGSGVWEASSVGVSSEGKASGVWEWESGNSWSGSSGRGRALGGYRGAVLDGGGVGRGACSASAHTAEAAAHTLHVSRSPVVLCVVMVPCIKVGVGRLTTCVW